MSPHFNPIMFEIEAAYTLIVVILCFLVYFKTKEIYDLSKHKGIECFRNAVLFFGLAYASRFIVYIFQLWEMAYDLFIPRSWFMPIFMIPTSFFSTIAIFYLAYSTFWRKVKYKHFLMFAYGASILISVIAVVSRSPMMVSLVQLPLLLLTLVVILARKSEKKKSPIRALYFLIALFWLLNLFVLGPRMFLPREFNIASQIISIGIFGLLYYKVVKWTR